MSYLDALTRASDRARTIARARQRDSKRVLFEVEALDSDLFDEDETEVDALREREARYAIAH